MRILKATDMACALPVFVGTMAALLLLAAQPARADNFCSSGHGSGGGGLIETIDGQLVSPLTNLRTDGANGNQGSGIKLQSPRQKRTDPGRLQSLGFNPQQDQLPMLR